VIRTRGLPWKSLPHPLLATLSIGVVIIGLIIPLTPLGSLFGFVLPPPAFYLFLVVAVAAYLVLVEAVKHVYYRQVMASAE
jgi:Mg2+-importing ATPase